MGCFGVLNGTQKGVSASKASAAPLGLTAAPFWIRPWKEGAHYQHQLLNFESSPERLVHGIRISCSIFEWTGQAGADGAHQLLHFGSDNKSEYHNQHQLPHFGSDQERSARIISAAPFWIGPSKAGAHHEHQLLKCGLKSERWVRT